MTAAQRFVPYAFARDNLILLRQLSERDAEVWIGDSTSMTALNEVMRVFPGRVRTVVVAVDKLSQAISQAYAHHEGSAQQVVGDIEGEFDISRMMQEVPDIEDLLETADDAPIIRMINALRTSTSRRSRTPRWCASGSTARCATWCGPNVHCTPRWCRGSRSWRSSISRRSACRRMAGSRCGWVDAHWMCASRPFRPGMVSAWCCGCLKRTWRAWT